MKNYKDRIAGLEFPVFVLFKNLKFEHDFDFDASVSRGEIIYSDKSYQAVKNKLPKPQIPEDEYKQSLLDSKYGRIDENELFFDDTVFDITEGEPCDYEIFGESYTIVWFSPPEEDQIIRYLIDEYRKYKNLVTVWSQYIDRMHLFPFDSLEISSNDFFENITSGFEEGVKSLPQPPSEQEWMELEEYL